MSPIRKFGYLAAVGLISLGCADLLNHEHTSLTCICFALVPLTAITRAEYLRAMSGRDVLLIFLVVFGLLTFAILRIFHLPGHQPPAFRHLIHHPAFVIPFWLLLLGLLYRSWSVEKREEQAGTDGTTPK